MAQSSRQEIDCRRVRYRQVRAAALAGCVLLIAACGSDDEDAGATTAAPATTATPETASSNGAASSGAIAIAITNDGCDPGTVSAAAGDVVFAITNQRDNTDRESEFEVLSAEPKILTEDFLEPGATGEVTLTLAAGEYELICGSPNQPRGTLTVTGEGGETATELKVDAAALQANVDRYREYVNGQLTEMVAANGELYDAIAGGDLDLAKSLYMPARVPWERIEPIAELFPDLDGSMDARADDFELAEQDPDFTGWHKLEWLMYDQQTLDGAEPIAAKLVADITELVDLLADVDIDPATMVNGSAGLIEEAANGKITGEEERYAKTDLLTFASNVEGARVIVDLNADLLGGVDANLYSAIIASFDAIDAALANYANGDGTYKLYDELTDEDRRPIQAELATLSENLAQVAGAFGLEVS